MVLLCINGDYLSQFVLLIGKVVVLLPELCELIARRLPAECDICYRVGSLINVGLPTVCRSSVTLLYYTYMYIFVYR